MKESSKAYRPAGRERAGLAARKVAATVLGRVVDERRSLEGLLDEQSGLSAYRMLIGKDRALIRAIVTVALRHRGRIEAALLSLLDRPPPQKARHLLHTLHVAAAQILYLDIPDSAAVDLAVTAISEDGRTSRFAAMANAVLRRMSRERDSLLATLTPDAGNGFPDWLAAQLRRDHGRGKADAIAAMVALEPVLDLTLSPRLEPSRAAALAEIAGGVLLPTGTLRIFSGRPVPQIEGYEAGEWWVQDAASALPVRMLGEVCGLEIADLCAAPGGKTAQLAAAGARVTAVDIAPQRLARLKENLARLRLEAQTVVADLLEWQPGRKFDAVLLDAPCSSTGTMRRHPDVAWTKTPADVEALAALQRRMLLRAAELVRPGGRLVYANCSLLKLEGEDLLASLSGQEGLTPEPLLAQEIAGTDGMVNGQGALRTLPFHLPADPPRNGGMDGFFACRFRIG